MKYIVYLFLTVVLCFSCNRKTKMYSLKGRLVNCDATPGANQVLEITQYPKSSGLGGSTRNKTRLKEKIVTDANGEFIWLYETNHLQDLEVSINEPGSGNSFYLPVENLDLGDIIYKAKTLLYCKIKVANAYTSSDTLLYSDVYSYPSIQLIGPFHDTVLGLRTVNRLNTMVYNPTSKKLETQLPGNSVGSSYRFKHRSTSPVATYSIMATCNAVPDTFVVTIH